jgi:hypothetical protein
VFLQVNADFHYIDVWSSLYTWGTNLSLPVDGDMIVVGPGQTLMVDTDTAIVKMLLIKGRGLIEKLKIHFHHLKFITPNEYQFN